VGEVVEVFLPTDRTTGRPRGFAFVEFTEDGAAGTAIERFNEKECNGRNLRVTAAEERNRSPRFGDGAGSPPPHHRKDRAKPKGSRRGLRAKKRSLF
jgi:RNA recognition motif-containing protein